MRIILSVVVALALMVGVAEAGLNQAPGARLTVNSSIQKEDLGTVADFGDLRARYVKFGTPVGDGTPVVAENAIWGVRQALAADTNGVNVVGFSVAAIDTGNYGWVAIAGITGVQFDTNTAVTGARIKCGARQDFGSCVPVVSDKGDSSTAQFFVGFLLPVPTATNEDSAVLKDVYIQGIR